jgi:hypothetical protein
MECAILLPAMSVMCAGSLEGRTAGAVGFESSRTQHHIPEPIHRVRSGDVSRLSYSARQMSGPRVAMTSSRGCGPVTGLREREPEGDGNEGHEDDVADPTGWQGVHDERFDLYSTDRPTRSSAACGR